MDKKRVSLAIFILFLSLTCIFAGISMAIFEYFGKGMTNNVIETGKVVFSYSDANGGTNGINIQNAYPISDDVGKIQSGSREYFDFNVTASTTSTDLIYEIVVKKDQSSTLPEENVKIYLTSFEGDKEVAVPLTSSSNVPTYNNLKITTNKLLSGKTLYYGTVKSGEVAYGKRFRLRMWATTPDEVNYDYSTVNNKTFSVKVNVAAVSAN